MQYFPSLLHTMVHRMHFPGVLAVTPLFFTQTSPRQKNRIFRKTETSDFPRQNIRTFTPKTRHFAAKKSEVFNFQKTASPLPPHGPHIQKAHQSITDRNIAYRQPHPKTAKTTPANPLKTTQNIPRKRHLPTQSENISKIIPKTFGRYTHTTYLCITQRNKDGFFSSTGKHPPKTGSSGKSGVNRKENKTTGKAGATPSQALGKQKQEQQQQETAKQQQP